MEKNMLICVMAVSHGHHTTSSSNTAEKEAVSSSVQIQPTLNIIRHGLNGQMSSWIPSVQEQIGRIGVQISFCTLKPILKLLIRTSSGLSLN